MDESTFKSKMLQAEIMHNLGDRPDYWKGYIRGLRRSYHGERFGTDAEHALWLDSATSDDTQRQERGLGYLDGLKA